MEVFAADRIVSINVDVQKDFCPGGSLAVPEGDQVVTPLNELNDFTRAQGGTVVFTGDQHPEHTPHFGSGAGQWPVHCVAGTEGAAFHDDLVVLPQDYIVDKGTGQTDGYSAFEGFTQEGQTLAELITPVGRERIAVIVGGLATEFCVERSVVDATSLDPQQGAIKVFVVNEAIRGINMQPGDSNRAIGKMALAGAVFVNKVSALTDGCIIKVRQNT